MRAAQKGDSCRATLPETPRLDNAGRAMKGAAGSVQVQLLQLRRDDHPAVAFELVAIVVVLVIVLGRPEFLQRLDFGHNGIAEFRLGLLLRFFSSRLLRLNSIENCGAVLR